jgi:hypothetical protein
MTTKIISIDEKNIRGQANFRLSKPMLDQTAGGSNPSECTTSSTTSANPQAAQSQE